MLYFTLYKYDYMEATGMDYKNAGVDIEAGYEAVRLMKKHVQSTMRPEVCTDIGGFSGAFSLSSFSGMKEPTLVTATSPATVPSEP